MFASSVGAPQKFEDLRAYVREHGTKKNFLADKLGVSRPTLDGLLLEGDRKPPADIFDVRSDLADRVGALIGQSAEHVRDYYLKAVAA
jgi:hypothetical protein